MTRDDMVTRTREFLSNADKTNPAVQFCSDLLMEMIYMETEMRILEDAARHNRERYEELVQTLRDEVDGDLPYKLKAVTTKLRNILDEIEKKEATAA